MSEQTSFLTPLVTQLGVGGVIGLCIGYAVKKIAKIVAVIVGLFSLGLLYLEYQGMISVDWLGVETWGNTALAGLGQMEGILGALISNLPFAGGAIVGFGLGIKMG
ncbi:MAG: FUN14 domain-containing protein [Candidatus Bathyarchaeota archaeon]|nr:FUN14 domain-containing protein [Candidatus Bathyarchaeota archaeon]